MGERRTAQEYGHAHVLHLAPITWVGKEEKDGGRPGVSIKEATQELKQIHQQQRRDKKHNKGCTNGPCKYKQCARTIHQGTFRFVQTLRGGKTSKIATPTCHDKVNNNE